MKRLLSIILCITVLLSSMAMISYAAEDIVHVGPKSVVNVAPGATAEVPIYMYNENGSNVKTELQDWSYAISEDVDFSTVSVEYGLFSVDDTPIYDDTKEVYTYIDGSNTITSTDVLFTLKFTAPSEAGDYTVATIDDSWAYLGAYAADGKTIVQLDNVSWDPIVIKVTGGTPAPDSYTVTFVEEDGTTQIGDPIIVTEGNAIGTLPTPPSAPTGKEFDKWVDQNGIEVTASTVVTSNMTVKATYKNVSETTYEDIIHVGSKQNKYNVSAGANVEVPIYMYNENGSDVKTELQDWSYVISEDVDFSTVSVEYGLFSADDTPIFDDTKEVYTYIDGSNTITSTDVLFTLKFVAPSINGEYTIATIDDSWAYLGGFAADGKTIVQLDNVSWDPIVVKVTGGVEAPKEYTVKFVEEDGTTLIGTPKTVLEGTTVGTLPTAPAVTGKTFDKWVDESGAEVTADTVVNGNMTVKATYTDNYYTVTFVEEDGTTTIGTPASIKHGDAVGSLPTAPAITGKTFDKWVDESGAEVTASTVVTKEMKVKATYKDIYYTVTFVGEDGTTTVGTPASVKHGATIGTLPTAPAVTGKTFAKWVDETDAEVTASTVVTKDMKVKATYTDNYYTLTFVEEDGTTTIGTPASVKHGEAIGSLPTAPAVTGKTFDKWVDESGAEVTAATKVTKDMKVKATYKDIYYDVTFVEEDGTTTIGTPASVKHGDAIGTLPTAPAVTGKTFAKWVDETDAEVTASTVVTKEMKVKATYTDNYYTVTFTGKEGAAIGEPESVKHGNKVTTVPTAPEVPGYEFVQWTVDGAVVADPADYEITKETEFKAEYRSLDPNTITDIEVVDADGKVVEAIEIPYGTAIDEIAAAISEAITVNEIKVEGKNNDVAYTTDEITERVDSIVIRAAGFEKTIALTYATEAIKIEATEKVSVPFKNHDGKTAAEIAEYVKGKITVTVYDIYGIEIEDAKYDVSDYDEETESVKVSYAGAEDVTVAVTLKAKSTGTSASSGTVVRPSTSVPTTKPGTEEPGTDKPGTDEPGTDVPGTDKPGTEEPGTDVPGTNAPFTDVTADDWAYDAIKDLYDRGVISGDATNTVRPADGITREEVSKIILNARGIEVDADAAIDATDANTVSDWAAGYVATAIKEGILKGYDDGTIQAGKVVTRAEFAAIIVRALGATSEYTASSFSDITADDWYAADVECAKSLGIVTGYEDGSFKGDQPVTRREAFVMVQRMIKLIEALEK